MSLARARAWIETVRVDLRGYPRLSTAVIAGHLIGDTATWGAGTMSMPLLMRPDREGMVFLGALSVRGNNRVPPWSSKETEWIIPPIAPRLTKNVVFLTNYQALSYSESTLDLITKYRLGVIVGSPSGGTNGNINPFALPGGYRVLWTGMRVLRHDGSRLHGVGILPDVHVLPTLNGILSGRDEVLERGLAEAERGAGAARLPH